MWRAACHQIGKQTERGNDQHEVKTNDDGRNGVQRGESRASSPYSLGQSISDGEEVGYSGEVRQDPIPVEPPEGQQLMKDLEIDDRDRDEDPILTPDRICSEHTEREDEIEVEAS